MQPLDIQMCAVSSTVGVIAQFLIERFVAVRRLAATEDFGDHTRTDNSWKYAPRGIGVAEGSR